MKTLTLLRHAKSSWGDPALGDFQRPLNARGEQAARAIGREIARMGLGFDYVLASPAVRVEETIAGLKQGGTTLQATFDRRLYLASARTLLALVHDTVDTHRRLLVVGHQPGLAELALLLTRDGALRDEVAAKYPTGALAELRFEAERWRDVAAGGGTLTRFVRPRDLVPD